jgi:6-phosphofructokinase 1
LGLSIKSRPVEIGYEVRCVDPGAFDLFYCSMLGYGVKQLFDEGVSGAMVTSDNKGDVKPLYLKDVEDENGKVKPRLVNMEGAKAKLVFRDCLQYITPTDYEAAKKYVANPEDYDFKKILNW